MGRRLDLQALLEQVLGSDHVYFQPPEGFRMSYPCIVYERERIDTVYANNKPYIHENRYTITAIFADPESPIPNRLSEIPKCSHDRQFKSDNLYHDVFTLCY